MSSTGPIAASPHSVSAVLRLRGFRRLWIGLGLSSLGDWLGLLVFVVSVVVIAAAWIAARPSVLAPIAGLFGKVGR